MTDRQPIFDLKETFDTEIAIGDQRLPIHVKRMSRGDLEAFDKRWKTLIVPPRGSAAPAVTATEDAREAYLAGELARVRKWNEDSEADRLKFYEDAIREYITVDQGLLRDRGEWVTGGAGLIAMFHSRTDVLGDLLAAIYVENHLGSVIKKNSSSRRGSEPGSGPSTPAPAGAVPASTAASAASSDTAASGAAPESRPADAGASSGAPDDETENVVH